MLARKKAITPHGKRISFRPDFIVEDVTQIDFDYLTASGYKAAMIDLDGTVVSRGTYNVPENTTRYLQGQPLKVYIATNRPKSRDLKDLRDKLHATGVIHPTHGIGKPFPSFYRRAALEHGIAPHHVVMIGDRYIQDIFGANLAGLTTIVVRKVGTAKGPVDKAVSRIERLVTNRLARGYEQLNK